MVLVSNSLVPRRWHRHECIRCAQPRVCRIKTDLVGEAAGDCWGNHRRHRPSRVSRQAWYHTAGSQLGRHPRPLAPRSQQPKV